MPGRPCSCCCFLLLLLTAAPRRAGIFVVQPHKLEEFVVPDLEGSEVRCLRVPALRVPARWARQYRNVPCLNAACFGRPDPYQCRTGHRWTKQDPKSSFFTASLADAPRAAGS